MVNKESYFLLKRVSQTSKGTFGVLMNEDGMPLCVTLEDPWKDNQKNISCVPPGIYEVTPHNGTRFKDAWLLNDVPNRTAILIHPGNSTDDTQGCILVGRSFNGHTIRDSRNAMEFLRVVLPDSFSLKII